jgi:hypothetical protein
MLREEPAALRYSVPFEEESEVLDFIVSAFPPTSRVPFVSFNVPFKVTPERSWTVFGAAGKLIVRLLRGACAGGAVRVAPLPRRTTVLEPGVKVPPEKVTLPLTVIVSPAAVALREPPLTNRFPLTVRL